MNRKILLAALAAGSLLGLGSVAQASPAVVAGTTPYYGAPAPYYGAPAPYYGSGYAYPQSGVVVQAAPPAPLYEEVPAPRAGYIWAPGHYVWNNNRYEWRGGEWMATRSGYGWQAAHWEQRGDGSWQLVAGHWVRSDNYAYGRNDWDRDGVVNSVDRRPYDPSRY